MLKRILLVITLFAATIPTSSLYASDEVGIVAKKWFTSFSYKVDLKYSDNKEITYFEWFNNKLGELLTQRKFTTNQIELINDLIKLSNERIFKLNRKNIESNSKNTLDSNGLVKDFRYISYNPEHIFLENWIWYSFNFDSHLVFKKDTIIREADLANSWINSDRSVVFLRDDGQLAFTNNYEKVKLISDSIIYWIPWKYNFLKEVKDDKRKIISETDYAFKSIKEITLQLTKWKTESEKIKVIYDYVLKNVQYTENYSLNDYRIFSWVNTYINKDWVCEWYTKLFLYMLNFSWLNHSEVVRWYVLDAQDFPEIWHAWVKVWDKYYDPTFDDPIGQKNTRNYSEYMYYWLPYDLFHVNRYDLETMPMFLKAKSVEFRESYIIWRMTALVYKYRNSWFNILKPYLIKLNNWITLDQKIGIEEFKKITEYYEVNNWKFTKDWITKNIQTLKYYNIDENNIEDLIKQLNYNLDLYYFFKWELEDWNYKYRLWYDIVYNR